MRDAFKINIPLGFLMHFLHIDQTAALPPLSTGIEEKDKRGDSSHSWNAHSCLNLEACLGSGLLHFMLGWKCCLKLGRKQASRAQTTDGTLAFTIRFTRGWNLGDTIWKRPRCCFRSTSCVVHQQKAGRVSGCQHTKGACMHESSYHWQTLGLAKSEQWSPKYIYTQNEPQTFHPAESTMRKIFPTDSQLVSIYSLSISNGPPLSEKLS